MIYLKITMLNLRNLYFMIRYLLTCRYSSSNHTDNVLACWHRQTHQTSWALFSLHQCLYCSGRQPSVSFLIVGCTYWMEYNIIYSILTSKKWHTSHLPTSSEKSTHICHSGCSGRPHPGSAHPRLSLQDSGQGSVRRDCAGNPLKNIEI